MPSAATAPEAAEPKPAAAAAVQAAEAVDLDAVFAEGYGLYQSGRYAESCSKFYRYVAARSFDDDRYEWALFFFGVGLHELGLSHAALETLTYLVSHKPNAKVVSYSLQVLERIAGAGPFDRDGLILNVLVEDEFGFVEDAASDFVHYYQGLYDWEHGYADWGNAHFARLRPGSPYHYRYLLQDAWYRIEEGRLEAATRILEQLAQDDQAPAPVRDDALVTLARVLYERSEFDRSVEVYARVAKPNQEQARYLLERAWNRYRLGQPQQAMGLLYAFEAPGFRRSFTAEYFILKSLIYKEVCHYRRALDMVGEFKERFRTALAHIYERGDPVGNEQVLVLAMQRKPVADLFAFLNLLEGEAGQVGALGDPDLAAFLQDLYALQLQQTGREFRTRVEGYYDALAAELLRYEEQANLLEYEIGLDMYQRASEFRYGEAPREASVRPATGVAVYPFQGEFWNDELADFRVELDNRCESLEEWDVFFE